MAQAINKARVLACCRFDLRQKIGGVKNTQQINRLTASTKTERNLFSHKVRQKQNRLRNVAESGCGGFRGQCRFKPCDTHRESVREKAVLHYILARRVL